MTKPKIDVSALSEQEKQELLDELWQTSKFEEVSPTLEESQRLDREGGADLERHYRHVTQFLRSTCTAANIPVPEDATLIEYFRLLRQSHPAFTAASQSAGAIDRIQQCLSEAVTTLRDISQGALASGRSQPLLEEPEAMFAVRSVAAFKGYLMARLNRS